MKKRVLQLIGSFHQGGSESQAISLARRLHEDSTFRVWAATLNHDGVLKAEAESIGLPPIPEFPLSSFYDANFLRQARRCAAFIKRNQIDLIHTHDFYTNVFGMAAATLAGTKARVTSKRETGEMRSTAQDIVERAAFRRSNAIAANSAAVREYLIHRGVRSEKVYVLYNGTDLSRFDNEGFDRSAFLIRYKLPSGPKLITMIANLRHSVKNVPMLLRTASKVTQRRSDVHFVVAGEGELLMDLELQAERLGIGDKVHFLGRCGEVPQLLSCSYACVLTSRAEGFSNSILEYMAAARPVVATRVGGAAEAILDGVTGHIVDSDDDAALAEKLLDLLADPEMAAQMGEAGKDRVHREFSIAKQISSTVALYDSLLN